MVSHRERQKVRDRRVKAAEHIREDERNQVTPTSEECQPISKVPVGTHIAVYFRASKYKWELEIHKKLGVRLLREMGYVVERVFSEVAKGWKLDREERAELHRARKYALKHKIPLAALDWTRYLRNFDHTKRPTRETHRKFMEIMAGVSLHTVNDPKASSSQGEAFLRDLQLAEEGRNPGKAKGKRRGYREERWEKYKDLSIRMRTEGKSNAEIARRVSKLSGFPISEEAIRLRLRNIPRGD